MTGDESYALNGNPPGNTRIHALYIKSGYWIDQIQVIYAIDGQVIRGDGHGGHGGSGTMFYLDGDEYITGIWGRTGNYVDSLHIETNKHRPGLWFGGNGGSFDYNYVVSPGDEIIGFQGRSGDYLDAIGVLTRKRC